jgi:hypothetical protein
MVSLKRLNQFEEYFAATRITNVSELRIASIGASSIIKP